MKCEIVQTENATYCWIQGKASKATNKESQFVGRLFIYDGEIWTRGHCNLSAMLWKWDLSQVKSHKKEQEIPPGVAALLADRNLQESR